MLAAHAAGVSDGQTIIDVCAAPGGKSIHMADLLNGSGHVSARDLTEMKILKIEENIGRTGLENISAHVQDALELKTEDIGKADIVMADLPCSGLGVIGRKPDIKSGMTPEKIEQLAKLQRQILSVVWQYVKPGGVLIYSTCTVTKAENEDNMHWFEDHFPFRLESMDAFVPEKVRNAQTSKGWIQILPGQFDSDGFFIARFRRNQDSED
jgi:16S rRNA (cytosine967-C5)-methyltransferase